MLTIGPPPPAPEAPGSSAIATDGQSGTVASPDGGSGSRVARPSSLDIVPTQRGFAVHGQVAVPHSGSRLVVELLWPSGRNTSRPAGRMTRSRVTKGRVRFAVALSPRARAALRRQGRLALIVRVRVVPPRARTGTLWTRRVLLRTPR